jgi:pyruvate dehydrogenase E1 component
LDRRADPQDIDIVETEEWLDALESVLEEDGPERAHFLIEALVDQARRNGAHLPYRANTAYTNTIPRHLEPPPAGDAELEWRIDAMTRWNAMAMVVNANRDDSGLGGHIASFASSATLYNVGLDHFFRAPTAEHGGDLVYFQGHSSPGIYARAFLEGRLDEADLLRFRREVGTGGLSSYPHPWLMPDFWQFPTVSMGLGPLTAIYQARFMKYLDDRELSGTRGRKVWAFMGDGEMDEPESVGAISLAARERLDNLIFVINCNLQRLDGPVRGNGSIIQEMEGLFRGAGWNVIKVIWGGGWDDLLARDKSGLLLQRMEECPDGEYQGYRASHDGRYIREHFFGKYPELKQLVAHLTDDDIWRLKRGGLDPVKVHAAYAAAVAHTGQPTLILAKTVKGYGMGEAGEGQNITHQQKKLGENALKQFRDRFQLPISDAELEKLPFYRPPADAPEIQYLKQRRQALGGPLPARRADAPKLEAPKLEAFSALLESSGERSLSTTMAFVRALSTMLRDKNLGPRVVPIVADEARTFGMEGMFRQLGIYASAGQLYTPVDADLFAYYREDKRGQILQEGICEAGATSSWIAAGTSYANHGLRMFPFYIFYSMFGFQRIGDLVWAAADMRTRGFLIGGTSGRTTLNGEGLQHQDGHSHLMAAAVPNCRAYDPTYAYELAVIVQDGLRQYAEEEPSHFYYITTLNENYPQPAMPEGVEAQILKGLYLLRRGPEGEAPRVQLMGSGAILREVEAAAELLRADFGVESDVWSVPSFTEAGREGREAERWSRMHPLAPRRKSFVEQQLEGHAGPVIAATDYVKAYADQIREYVPRRYVTLGTDGFGRSDTREQLRWFFEVNRHWVVVSALKALADEGRIAAERVAEAFERYGLDAEKPDPTRV